MDLDLLSQDVPTESSGQPNGNGSNTDLLGLANIPSLTPSCSVSLSPEPSHENQSSPPVGSTDATSQINRVSEYETRMEQPAEGESSSVNPTADPAATPAEGVIDRYKERSRSQNIFSIVAPYCEVSVLLNLAQVSHEARDAATADSVWAGIYSELATDDAIAAQGSTAEPNSFYKRFLKVRHQLSGVIDAPESELDGATDSQIASRLGDASRLALVTGGVPENLKNVIESHKTLLLEKLTDIEDDNVETVNEVFRALEVWEVKTNDLTIRQKSLDLYSSYKIPTLPVEDPSSFSDALDDGKYRISQSKLEDVFSEAASSLVNFVVELQDENTPIPSAWRPSAWTAVLSKCVVAIGGFIQEVLAFAAKVSELEYLTAVPKIYVASATLSGNSLIKEYVGTGLDLATSMDLTMRPVIEEFCDRQASYVEHFAREKVSNWNKSVSQREHETEASLWSNVPKKSDKTNFISSFKWAFLSADQADDKSLSTPNENAHPNLDNTEDPAPATEFEAQTAVLVSKLRGMEALVSIELAIEVLETCRAALHRLKSVSRMDAETYEPLFCIYLKVVGREHIQASFEKAIRVLNEYDPKRYGRLLISVGKDEASSGENISSEDNTGGDDVGERANAVEPLAVFTELMNIGDLVQQMVHVFFEEELVAAHIVRRSDFAAPSVNAKRKFEQMLDNLLAEGLSRGIDVLMEQVDFTLLTEQLGSDYLPLPTEAPAGKPTEAAMQVIGLVRSHLNLLQDSTEKSIFDVFQQEVGMRLYNSLTKHIKRQTISIDGAINLISDVNAYYAYIASLKQKNIMPYYETLKQIAQLFLIDTRYAKQIGLTISDSGRYNGVVTTEELVEFVKRRQDWPLIKTKVEKVLYGIFECIIC